MKSETVTSMLKGTDIQNKKIKKCKFEDTISVMGGK